MAIDKTSGLTTGLTALAGGMGARLLDDAAPSASYTFTLMGRTFTVRASTAIAAVVLLAPLAGMQVPEALTMLAAGALAYEVTAEVGDDFAAMVLGLPLPGSPSLPAGPPAVTPTPMGYQPVNPYFAGQGAPAFAPQGYAGQVMYPDDAALAQSLAAIRSGANPFAGFQGF